MRLVVIFTRPWFVILFMLVIWFIIGTPWAPAMSYLNASNLHGQMPLFDKRFVCHTDFICNIRMLYSLVCLSNRLYFFYPVIIFSIVILFFSFIHPLHHNWTFSSAQSAPALHCGSQSKTISISFLMSARIFVLYNYIPLLSSRKPSETTNLSSFTCYVCFMFLFVVTELSRLLCTALFSSLFDFFAEILCSL